MNCVMPDMPPVAACRTRSIPRNARYRDARRGQERLQSSTVDLGAFDHVARVAEVADRKPPSPAQQNEIGGVPTDRRIAHQHRRAAFDQARAGASRRLGIIGEIVRPACRRWAWRRVEPHVFGQHVAHGIEIAGIEAVDIGGESARCASGQRGKRPSSGSSASSRRRARPRCSAAFTAGMLVS